MNSKGMTLIEVLIATALLAMVAGILLTAFGFSLVSTKKAENTLSSTFVAQSRMEEIHGMDVATALEEGRGERRLFMDKYVETIVKPYFRENCHAFYVILGGALADVYAVPPDNSGALQISTIMGSRSMNISISANSYSIASAGYETLEGSLPPNSQDIMVLINGVKYSSPANVTINVTAAGCNVSVWVYDGGSNSSRIEVTGSNVEIKRFSGYTYRDYSTVKVQVKVYEREDDLQPSANFSSILQLKN
ncbi:MAG: type II secretion system protein [Clostridia bacterium]|nr:hypothetical protein [Clostridia bacterium]